jgi:membrane associated rhomboid family serine protease
MISEGGFTSSFLGLVIDENPTMRIPWATLGLILVNVAALVWFLIYPERIDPHLLRPERLVRDPVTNLPELFTSMFLHAGFAHLIGNMYFLFVFGDNVEDRIGVTKYLLLYLTSGLFSGFMYAHLTSHPEIPVLGASGAVSGILGAYLILYPKAKLRSHTMILFRPIVLRLPVWFYLGVWFLGMQALNQALKIPGVAWYAHIAGFIYGAAVMLIMRKCDLL